jgi:hypothetical protein
MLRRAPLALLAVIALAGAGCAGRTSSKDSSGRFQGEQRLVANTVEDLQSATAKGDQDKICSDLLARALADRLARGGTCQATVDAVLKDTDSSDLTVQSVTIAGASATARVKAERGSHDEIVTLGLVKQGTSWRISDLGR